jgi:hypothetical protein
MFDHFDLCITTAWSRVTLEVTLIRLIIIIIWLYSPLLDLGRFFSFLILYTVGRIPWTGDQSVARITLIKKC